MYCSRGISLFLMVVAVPFWAHAADLPVQDVTTLASPVKHTTNDDDDLNIAIPAVNEAPFADPWEGFNRPIFGLNKALDSYVLKPVASGYRWVLPEMVREGFGNFFDNLGEPVNCINGILQLNPQKGFSSFWRFALNSTFGLAGFYDFAGQYGHLPHKKHSFGDTLETYGVDTGPYLVVPLYGPSNPRDTVGDVVDFAIDPFTYIGLTPIDNELTVLEVVDQRDQNAVLLDEIYGNSIEPYVAMRSAYLQNKSFVSRNGKTKQFDE
jgi:phospholipid-binding lipoprotein MlaA